MNDREIKIKYFGQNRKPPESGLGPILDRGNHTQLDELYQLVEGIELIDQYPSGEAMAHLLDQLEHNLQTLVQLRTEEVEHTARHLINSMVEKLGAISFGFGDSRYSIDTKLIDPKTGKLILHEKWLGVFDVLPGCSVSEVLQIFVDFSLNFGIEDLKKRLTNSQHSGHPLLELNTYLFAYFKARKLLDITLPDRKQYISTLFQERNEVGIALELAAFYHDCLSKEEAESGLLNELLFSAPSVDIPHYSTDLTRLLRHLQQIIAFLVPQFSQALLFHEPRSEDRDADGYGYSSSVGAIRPPTKDIEPPIKFYTPITSDN